jgi:hypothetical protein
MRKHTGIARRRLPEVAGCVYGIRTHSLQVDRVSEDPGDEQHELY